MSGLLYDGSGGLGSAHLQRRRLDNVSASTIVLSTTPFFLTWLATAVVAQRHVYPRLTRDADAKSAALPLFNGDILKSPTRSIIEQLRQTSAHNLVSLVFSGSLGLCAVLVELLLFEILDTLNPAVRGLALRITLSILLVVTIVITPALEIHSISRTTVRTSEESSTSTRRRRSRLVSILDVALFAAWLFLFWYIPQASVLRDRLRNDRSRSSSDHAFMEACLERVGIIGISLMASLAGFAAVSSLWQTFGVRHRTIRESDISRKEAGLAATAEMLQAKQSRLRAIQRKLSEASPTSEQSGFLTRVVGQFRGTANTDVQELKALQLEVSGLETMHYTLSSSLSTLRAHYIAQQRSQTHIGRLLAIGNTAFAIYCAYRIAATSISSLRRWWQPNHSFATSDPINNILALLTTHYDSSLDRAAWSRQFSFLLSGFMLLASFSAVLQTFRLFSRFAPGLLQHAQTSLPLVISQIAATYVISSALLLRSNLPAEVSGVISEALGAPLEARFVEGWFESWFLVAVGFTAVGILVGRKIAGNGDDLDDDDWGWDGGGNKRH